MRIRNSLLVSVALGLAWLTGVAQKKAHVEPRTRPDATVQLEPHESQTKFKLGDPVTLDLVFITHAAGYSVRTDRSPYLPVSDEVLLAPNVGWVRAHSSYRGLALNGNAMVGLGKEPVRVPILLNRTITFRKPGHYDVTVRTERLRTAATLFKLTTLETCDPCRTTNGVNIEIVAADEREEAALVETLSRQIRDTEEKQPEPGRFSDEIEAIAQEIAASRDEPEATRKAHEQAILGKMNKLAETDLAIDKKGKEAHLNAAVHLAYLGGDDAIRAKVQLIVEDKDRGASYSIGEIMVDGLPSSRNFELQLELMHAAWLDLVHVPTSILHTALRESRELVHNGSVTDEGIVFSGTEQKRKAAVEQYQGDISEIVATLPRRTEANRAETIKFLNGLGVLNPFSEHPQQ